jgi:hypothetical protein
MKKAKNGGASREHTTKLEQSTSLDIYGWGHISALFIFQCDSM